MSVVINDYLDVSLLQTLKSLPYSKEEISKIKNDIKEEA